MRHKSHGFAGVPEYSLSNIRNLSREEPPGSYVIAAAAHIQGHQLGHTRSDIVDGNDVYLRLLFDRKHSKPSGNWNKPEN